MILNIIFKYIAIIILHLFDKQIPKFDMQILTIMHHNV